jgi:hypothetical protein
MVTENILRQSPATCSGLLISIGAVVLALVLAAPSQCQTNRESSLPDPAPNSAPYINSAILASVKLLGSPALALPEPQSSQDHASPPDAAAKTTGEDNDKARKAKPASQSGTSNDRLFDVLPNFLTLENAGQVPPLTTGQKFRVVARGSFDFVEFFWYGLLAGISQAENSEPGYHQGAAGYGKRYGAYFADGTIENFMTQAVFASVLRQDPRYYQSGQGRFLHRVGYAVSRIFITRTDSGGEQFNFSEIFGSAVASGISTYAYHPHADRTLPNTASVWGTQVGYDTITIVVKEFWPDIRRKFSHKTQPAAAKP